MTQTRTLAAAASPFPGLGEARLYLATAALVLGNVLLPWALHRIPDGGRMFLPLFFFTLIAGWRFGAKAGLLTGVLSPLANHVLTGLPPAAALQGLMLQSAFLGLLAALAARRCKPTWGPMAAVVLLHQSLLLLPAPAGALATLRLHLPAILLQLLGGYAVLRFVLPPREA